MSANRKGLEGHSLVIVPSGRNVRVPEGQSLVPEVKLGSW